MYEQAVDNGIQYLAENDGPDFVNRIDIHGLDQATAAKCMLGQLDGVGYTKARTERKLSHPEAIAMGFFLPEHTLRTPEMRDNEWQRLTETWQRKLHAIKDFQKGVAALLASDDAVVNDRDYEREMVYG